MYEKINVNAIYPQYSELTSWNGEKRKMLVWDNMGGEPKVAFVTNYVAGIWVTKEQVGYFHAAEIPQGQNENNHWNYFITNRLFSNCY